MYHDIIKEGESISGFQNDTAFRYKIDVNAFERQVKALAHRNDIIFTFDDGGISSYTLAAPILEKYGRTGIFFVCTQYIGKPGFLSESQIKELAFKGHIIGSHSHTHPMNMASLSKDGILKEWRDSCKILEDILGKKVETASIPNGYGSEVLYELAKYEGIRYLYTSIPTISKKRIDNLHLLGRFVIHRGMTTDNVIRIATNKKCQIKMYHQWQLLSVVKRMMGNKYETLKGLLMNKK